VVHGRLFGMGQSKAHQWIHVLLPALLAAVDMVGGGVCARCPGLTVAFLEGNCS
jgi:hypothetical protein